MVGLICLCCLRADKLTSAADKSFEGISKAVCERISHSRPDNMNGYQTDEDFFVNGYGSAVGRLNIFHVLKPETTK